MAEEIAALNNVNQDLVGQVTKLESNLKSNNARLGELEELIISLQEERSALQLKLKQKQKRKPNV
jgi:regulator of replication initiation timing